MTRPQPRAAHERQERLAHEHRPVEVDAHHALPEFEVEFVPGGGFEDGGVVGQDVDSPEVVCYSLAYAVDDCRAADIQRYGHGRVADTRNQLTGLSQVADVADDDGSSLPGEAHSYRLPDAAGGSRHYGDSSCVWLSVVVVGISSAFPIGS